jgi:rfaE bifunctional protein kinase chain/domain
MQLTDINIDRILQRCSNLKVMVIGDLMLDRYLWGNVTRISPEAPVPIINIEDEDVRFGGAANVANNLIGLNVSPVVVGVVGADKWGKMFRDKLLEKSLQTEGLIVDESRPTTIKTRIIGNNQHIARVDREKKHPISRDTFDKIADFIESEIPKVDAIILEDYNKGLLTVDLIEKAVSMAQKHNKIITVDPKFDNFLAYRNVTVFKPNRKETAEALAMRVESEQDIRLAGEKLLEILNAQNVLITLGAKGMALFGAIDGHFFIPTHARKVADVSGAGDTVIATLTSVLAANGNIREAVIVANVAAGVVCEEVGAVPITSQKLREAFTH